MGLLIFVLGIVLGITVNHWLFLVCGIPLAVTVLHTFIEAWDEAGQATRYHGVTPGKQRRLRQRRRHTRP